MQVKYLILLLLGCACLLQVHAQDKQQLAGHSLLDTTRKAAAQQPVKLDSLRPAKNDTVPIVMKKKHDPRKATIRSAIIPGWGQIYNREYWKVPIVWGALAIPAVTFVYNNTWYKRTRQAYPIVLANDTAHFNQIYPGLFYKNSDGELVPYDPSSLQQARNQFRQNRDFSLLWFFILWGVNVVDATVFGHLKDFDVSDDLSMHIEPTLAPVVNTPGISLVFNFRNRKPQVAHLPGYY